MDMSYDGSRIYSIINEAVSISTDSGYTWNRTSAGATRISSVVASEDGKYILLSNCTHYQVYKCVCSNDYGISWSNGNTGIIPGDITNTIHMPFTFNMNVTTVAISETGQYQLVPCGGSNGYGIINTGYVYVSNDYGVSFNIPNSLKDLNKRWEACGMSKDGSIMWVGNYETYLYKSTDYGVTWTYVNIPGSTPDVYSQTAGTGTSVYSNKIAISKTGQIVALTSNTTFCVSTDGGNTWNISPYASNANYNCCVNQLFKSSGMSMSYDGKIIVTCSFQNNGYDPNIVYYSIDYGQNWNTLNTNMYGTYGFGISWIGNVIYAGSKNGRYNEDKLFKKLTSSSQYNLNGIAGIINKKYFDYNNNIIYIGGKFQNITLIDGTVMNANNIVSYNFNTNTWNYLGVANSNGVLGSSSRNNEVNNIYFNPSDNFLYVIGYFNKVYDSNGENTLITENTAKWDIRNKRWII